MPFSQTDIQERLDTMRAKRGGGAKQSLPSPAPISHVVDAADYVRDRYDLALPEIAKVIWERCDGFNFNGYYWYRPRLNSRAAAKPFIDDFVSVNETFSGVTKRGRLCYGESDMDQFIYDVAGDFYATCDKVSGDVFERFPSVEALFCFICDKAIALWDEKSLPDPSYYID